MNSKVTLEDKYTLDEGQIYLNGSQALSRLPMAQRRRDLAQGLDTAGFISGYRGSPLARYDHELWRAQSHLDRHQIHFEPGVNEDLAATAILGTQQIEQLAGSRHDGVFSIWYGKGPGVDRSGDALKHGAYSGTGRYGGVLAIAGDDHGCRSSTIPYQSDQAFIHYGMPILNPASIAEYLELGLYGFALSRFSGCWIGFKCITDTLESSASVFVNEASLEIKYPVDFEMPEGGLNIQVGRAPLLMEEGLIRYRLVAAKAFVRANRLDRVVLESPQPRIGIVTSGKSYFDVLQGLAALGLDERAAGDLGITIYKVAMPWPLEPDGILEFASGLEELIVVEEKRQIIEEQLSRLLINQPERPRVVGKEDERGAPLFPSHGELPADLIGELLRPRLLELAGSAGIQLRPNAGVAAAISNSVLFRGPSFCSGCPHNTSTRVPEGSLALGGIGCHGMASFLPERNTPVLHHMGGEGGYWIGQAPFSDMPHIFQNMGDGTYFHSGLLAIRANVAAGTNITYKILFNGVVAMTGAQPIEGVSSDGVITVPEIAWQVHSEGVKRVAIVSNEPTSHKARAFPPGTDIFHRDELDRVQKEMRELTGTTVIVFDQPCAAELRRRRKRGAAEDPDLRVVINERVCEGCGDCGIQSNCIAIEPVETSLGRKRRINQSACNKDVSCLKGLCPSFVTVRGGTPRKANESTEERAPADDRLGSLPPISSPSTREDYSILVAGIGGTGVVTIGALIGMAAHLEGRSVTILDNTGASQKNGSVMSHIQIGADSVQRRAPRLPRLGADLLIGCDIVVSGTADALDTIAPGVTNAIVNEHVAPTAAFATQPSLDFSSGRMRDDIESRIGDSESVFLNATQIATRLMGDAIATNLFLTGYALQRGWIPLGSDSIDRAIELNGVAVAMNKQALAWGRLFALDPKAVLSQVRRDTEAIASDAVEESIDTIIQHRSSILTQYQSPRYARRYEDLVARVRLAEQAHVEGSSELTKAVARSYFHLLAYKDEYEVARLYSDGQMERDLEAQLEGDLHVSLELAPPLFARRDKQTGRLKKHSFGPWIFPVLRRLASLKFLRGTPADIFGYTAHRRMERRLIREYEETVEELIGFLTPAHHSRAIEVAALPTQVLGFDHVKEAALAEVEERKAKLLEELRNTTS